MKKNTTLHIAAAMVAIGLLACSGSAIANAAEVDDDSVDVTVEISDNDPGALTLSVAANTVALTENGSTVTQRQFTGTLPTVTVTDTRDVVPVGAAWAVVASTTNFTGDSGQPAIPAANLGWTPQLVAGDGEGFISEGLPVEGALEGGPGVVDEELLFTTADSGEVNPGSWSATAALKLLTAANVAPGSYSATMTLSLFE